jgi:NADH-quinone oxidoreductase subunit N
VNLQTDILVVLPELVMAVGAMMLLLVGAIGGGATGRDIAVGGNRSVPIVTWGSIGILLLAGIWIWLAPEGTAFNGAFISDSFSRFAKVLILCGAALTVLLADEFFASLKLPSFELPVLILLTTVGMMVMVSAASFLALYMGMELQSLALYVLAAFNRDDLRSSEAGLKYFVLGALSSGMMLYGISLIYGFTGSTVFTTVAAVTTANGASLGIIFGIVFLVAGLAYKISAVPFHMWTPDVYEGAPTPIAAYFATAVKVAALCLFLRAILVPFPHLLTEWRQIILILSILSMVLGAIAAIGQVNIKRMMAYSAISHMGYALLGLAAGTPAGVRGVLIYLTIYVFTNMGVFACIQTMRRKGRPVEKISDLAGLGHTDLRFAVLFAILMVSMGGVPPLAGFVGKFFVFLAAIQAGLVIPAVIGVLAATVSLVYYLGVVKTMLFDAPGEKLDSQQALPMERTVTWIGVAVAMFFIVFAGPVVTMADAAAKALLS